jgi:hypothetical protein
MHARLRSRQGDRTLAPPMGSLGAWPHGTPQAVARWVWRSALRFSKPKRRYALSAPGPPAGCGVGPHVAACNTQRAPRTGRHAVLRSVRQSACVTVRACVQCSQRSTHTLHWMQTEGRARDYVQCLRVCACARFAPVGEAARALKERGERGTVVPATHGSAEPERATGGEYRVLRPTMLVPSRPVPSHPVPSRAGHAVPCRAIPCRRIASHRVPSHPIHSRPASLPWYRGCYRRWTWWGGAHFGLVAGSMGTGSVRCGAPLQVWTRGAGSAYAVRGADGRALSVAEGQREPQQRDAKHHHLLTRCGMGASRATCSHPR